ncbi:MAG: HAMP domain-containing sensor histidine kinase [Gemmatimonadaceae bacterium]
MIGPTSPGGRGTVRLATFRVAAHLQAVAPAPTFRRALLGAIALALLAGVIPAGVMLDRQLAGALETRARSDLALAPALYGGRQASSADAMMMHAKEFAHSAELADALVRGDRARARRIAEEARAAVGGEPVVVGPEGDVWAGPATAPALAEMLQRTRRGEMPVATVGDSMTLNDVALAPVHSGARWVGAAGLANKIDEQRAAAIAGLTRADVIVFVARADSAADTPIVARTDSAAGMRIVATTLDTATTGALTLALQRSAPDSAAAVTSRDEPSDSGVLVRELTIAGRRLIAVVAPAGAAGTIALVRDLDTELAVLPRLRRLAFWSAIAALASALSLGFALATRIARPMRALAGAADALARGDFGAPAPNASDLAVREVRQLASAFSTMRSALAARIAELHDANHALADRNTRLTALQADLVQRERLVATGRLVTHLAHEIRNPVAGLRNCLELIRRRLADDPEGREFADLAIDELLRMHELAEQMLDVNRPRSAVAGRCHPADTVRDVVSLLMAGAPADAAPVTWSMAPGTSRSEVAAIPVDSLKQVLLNLAQNGRDAISTLPRHDARATESPPGVHILLRALESSVEIEVHDDGPGVPADILPRIFDPFFTTKPEMRGVGLGLSIAESLVRGAGGRLTLANHDTPAASNGAGTTFVVTLPRVLDLDISPVATNGSVSDGHAYAPARADRPSRVS